MSTKDAILSNLDLLQGTISSLKTIIGGIPVVEFTELHPLTSGGEGSVQSLVTDVVLQGYVSANGIYALKPGGSSTTFNGTIDTSQDGQNELDTMLDYYRTSKDAIINEPEKVLAAYRIGRNNVPEHIAVYEKFAKEADEQIKAFPGIPVT